MINWGQTPDTANIYISLHKMKFYKQRLMLNYQNIPGSHNDRKCIAKYPYSPLYAEGFVNEFKAIDTINYTDKWNSEILIYDEFQFVDLPYFHKPFIWSFNHTSQSFKSDALVLRAKSTREERRLRPRQKCCQKKQMKPSREIIFFSSDIVINNVKKKSLLREKVLLIVLCKVMHI